MSAEFNRCLEAGVALFNAGRFYEAHEAWEEAWRREQGPRRELLQGLIQVAAAWLKRDAGQLQGARTLFDRALGRLERLPSVYEGVEVERLRAQVARWREGPGEERPAL